MDKERFESEHGAELGNLRAARGPCPPGDELLDWLEGTSGGERAEAIERHVTLCTSCADAAARARAAEPEVDDLAWQRTARRLDQRPASWRPARLRVRGGWLAAAAAAVAVVAALVVYRAGQEETLAPSLVAATRDAEITLIEPAGEAPSVQELRWQGIPAPVRYRIEVIGTDEEPGTAAPLWVRVTTETRLEADGALQAIVERERSLRWRVVIIDEEGHELERSAWTDFELIR